MIMYDLFIRIDPRKIAFLKFIIEGYDGLATITTVDRSEGLVKLVAPGSRLNELWPLLSVLSPICRKNDSE